MCLFIDLFIYLFITYLSVYLFIFFIYVFICLFIYFIYVFIYLPIYIHGMCYHVLPVCSYACPFLIGLWPLFNYVLTYIECSASVCVIILCLRCTSIGGQGSFANTVNVGLHNSFCVLDPKELKGSLCAICGVAYAMQRVCASESWLGPNCIKCLSVPQTFGPSKSTRLRSDKLTKKASVAQIGGVQVEQSKHPQ